MIKNKINGKMYIGQTVKDINIRWRDHKRKMHTNNSPHLYASFRKHGIDNFDFKIICICFDDACDEIEKHYISKYNTISPNGYNIEAGGNTNKIIHEDTRKKISAALTGKKHSEERIQKMRLALIKKGFKHTDEAKKKMSELRKGRKVSEQGKINMSNGQKGHKVTDYTKQRVAEANKKRIWTKEMKEKMGKISSSNNMKKVGQYTLDNIFIKEYNGIKTACEDTLISRNTIGRCCRKEIESGKGYIWKFI
jgi:group I intron endonuclease